MLYDLKTHSSSTLKYLEAMKKIQSSHQVYLTSDDIEYWEQDGVIHTHESLFLKKGEPIYKKEDVPEKFMFGKPFQTVA